MSFNLSRPEWSIDHQLALAKILDQAIGCSAPIASLPSGSSPAPEGRSSDFFYFPTSMADQIAVALQLPGLATFKPACGPTSATSLDDVALAPTAHCLPPLANSQLPTLLQRLSSLQKWLTSTILDIYPPAQPPATKAKSGRKSLGRATDSPTSPITAPDVLSSDWLPQLWRHIDSLDPSNADAPGADPLQAAVAETTPEDASITPPVTPTPQRLDGYPTGACPNLQAGLIARVTLLQERLQWTDRLEQAKLASLKRLAYGASHEINNPLANIATRAQTLLTSEMDLQRRQSLQTINAQAFRAFDMLANLMHYAAPPPHRPQYVELGPILQQNVTALRRQLAHPDRSISLELPDRGLHATLDPQQFGVLVQALVRNAVEAVAGCPETAAIIVRLGSQEVNSGDQIVLLDVLDTGPPPAHEALPYLCDPFYSGREAGRGLGFGLAKALRIVEAHGGYLTWNSCQTGGFHVRVILPQPSRTSLKVKLA